MSEIRVDTISERTNANGVTIDGLTIKDGGITATTGAIVFNEASADLDFRVESNDNTHALFVDAGNNRVGINTSSPGTTLQVGDGSAQTRVRIMSPNDSSSVIDFADPDDGNVGSIAYHHGDTEMIFRVADVDQHKFKAGEVVFNEASADVDFRVESNGNANMLFVDGGNDRIGIGTGTPQAQFDLTVPNAKTASAGVWGYLGKTNEGSGYGALQCFQVGHANAASRQWQFQTIEQGVANDGIITLQLSGGNVAIGRSTADAKLDVSGGIRTSSGILFGTDTAAANALDDYEEGTWTAAIKDASNNAVTMGDAAGSYTKVGRLVFVSGYFRVNGLGSASGNVRITGLPFAVPNNNDAYASVSIGYAANLNNSAVYVMAGYTGKNTSDLILQNWDAAHSTSSLQASELSLDGEFILSCSYYTA